MNATVLALWRVCTQLKLLRTSTAVSWNADLCVVAAISCSASAQSGCIIPSVPFPSRPSAQAQLELRVWAERGSRDATAGFGLIDYGVPGGCDDRTVVYASWINEQFEPVAPSAKLSR